MPKNKTPRLTEDFRQTGASAVFTSHIGRWSLENHEPILGCRLKRLHPPLVGRCERLEGVPVSARPESLLHLGVMRPKIVGQLGGCLRADKSLAVAVIDEFGERSARRLWGAPEVVRRHAVNEFAKAVSPPVVATVGACAELHRFGVASFLVAPAFKPVPLV